MGEIKRLKLWDVLKAHPEDPYSDMDKEAIAYFEELAQYFPLDYEIDFCEDGTLSKECRVYKVFDGSIDAINDEMLHNADAFNLDLRKIINDKPKYLKMFSELFEKCYANM